MSGLEFRYIGNLGKLILFISVELPMLFHGPPRKGNYLDNLNYCRGRVGSPFVNCVINSMSDSGSTMFMCNPSKNVNETE